ncbi:hypothetical protein FACS1894217_04510 [Clostridia bacterium]|nr:hypothetical protein FACS1894217_04510 [Clostridia bacterium]
MPLHPDPLYAYTESEMAQITLELQAQRETAIAERKKIDVADLDRHLLAHYGYKPGELGVYGRFNNDEISEYRWGKLWNYLKHNARFGGKIRLIIDVDEAYPIWLFHSFEVGFPQICPNSDSDTDTA